ncbi:MAG: hypothetical protein F4229_05690 [Gammaproteobacteria bacterium]|nr:hypothetical protein [Gammaproteobacteria bacterium]
MEARGIEVADTVPASRKLQRADAQDLLKKASRVSVAKGRKLTEFSGDNVASDEAATAMLGTTGNLRAPTIVVGETLLVGFNEALYTEVFG